MLGVSRSFPNALQLFLDLFTKGSDLTMLSFQDTNFQQNLGGEIKNSIFYSVYVQLMKQRYSVNSVTFSSQSNKNLTNLFPLFLTKYSSCLAFGPHWAKITITIGGYQEFLLLH